MSVRANPKIDECVWGPAFADFGPELERHQLRRNAGVPTVSVLIGAPATAISVWGHWSIDRGRQVVVAADTEQGRIIRQWLATLSEHHCLTEAALAWLAESSGRLASELAQSLSGKTSHERDVLLQSVVRRCADRDAAKLCQWILLQPPEMSRDAEQLAEAMCVLFADREHPAVSGLDVINRLMAAGTAPTLLVVQPENVTNAIAWIDVAVQALMPITQEAPSLPVALSIPPLDFHQYIESTHESRRVATLRETVLQLAGVETSAIRRHIEQSVGSTADCVEESICRLVRDGCSEELARCFTEAASAVLSSDRMIDPALNEEESELSPARSDDAARSAAERFLFERLQSLPETRGLFELNGKLQADFGPAGEAEVDLLGRQIRMAIEIDGYYHFQNPDSYRRDRRKDVALQKLDYFVLRVLAEDVVKQLGATLDVILDAVSFPRDRCKL